MSLLRNLLPRFQLLRIALTQRFIYPEVVALAEAYGVEYRDLRADLQPFAFVRHVLGESFPAAPDFAPIGPAEGFTPPGAPQAFNSEASVAQFLGELVFQRNARSVVELGCFVGWTTAHMARALQARNDGGRLFALDYRQDYLDLMLANLHAHGKLDQWVTPLRGMSLDPAVLAALPEKIDVLFIDTSHSYPETRDEILAYAPRLAPGGCMVLHDAVNAAGVRRSINELAGRFRVLTFATEHSNGVTVLMPA